MRPPLPDPREIALPMKDVLRGVRHALREGRRRLDLGPVAAPLDAVAAGVEEFTSAAAHTILDFPTQGAGLGGLRDDGSDLRFAQTVYHGLDRVLARLGLGALMVSETLAAEAFRTVQGRDGALAIEEYAADLLAELQALRVVGHPPGLATVEDEGVLVAHFAVMLWLLVERDVAGEDEDALLDTCTDVAEAERGAVLAAGADRAALAQLLANTYPAI